VQTVAESEKQAAIPLLFTCWMAPAIRWLLIEAHLPVTFGMIRYSTAVEDWVYGEVLVHLQEECYIRLQQLIL
jgi:hypothetical protein